MARLGEVSRKRLAPEYRDHVEHVQIGGPPTLPRRPSAPKPVGHARPEQKVDDR